jgi:hypothetical protein
LSERLEVYLSLPEQAPCPYPQQSVVFDEA